MNQRANMFDTLIYLAIVVAIIVVLFLMVFPAFRSTAEAAIEKGKCEITILLSALVQTGSIGAIEVPPACKMKMINISMASLKNEYVYAQNRLATYNQNKEKYAEILEVLPKDKNEAVAEFALDKIIADELDDCWGKVLRGKLPIYSNEYFSKRINCIICARIKFDQEVIQLFQNKQIRSLVPWMQYNPLKGTSTAYWKFITEDQTGVTGLAQPRYDFSVGPTPVAVVFVNMRATTAEKVWGRVAGWAGAAPSQDINTIRLVPFTQDSIRKDIGCDPDSEIS